MKKFLLSIGTGILTVGLLAACGPAEEEGPVEGDPIMEEPAGDDAIEGDTLEDPAEDPADDLEGEEDLELEIEDGDEEEEETQG